MPMECNVNKWTKKHPDKEGIYWMKDESGGPTLYEFIFMDGVLCCGPLNRKVRTTVGVGMLNSCRWKIHNENNIN